MATKTPKAYVDSCCFTEPASYQVGKHDPGQERDVQFLRALLDAAFDGQIELYTSSLSVSECLFVRANTDKKQERIFTDDVKANFRAVLTSGQFVALVQDTILIAEQARDLLWVHGIPFGGADGIHVASAIASGCEEFLTFDHCHIISKAAELEEKFGLRAVLPRNSVLVPKSKHPDAGPLLAGVGALKDADTKNQPQAAEVRGGGDGHPEDQAGAQDTKSSSKPKENDKETSGVPQPEEKQRVADNPLAPDGKPDDNASRPSGPH